MSMRGRKRTAVAVLAVGLCAPGLGGCSGGKRATSSPTKESMTRYNLARIYLEQGKVQESIALLQQVTRDAPRYAEARNLLGLAHWSVTQRPQARAEFERALEINPLLTDARVNLGVVLSEEGDYARAEAEFRRALEDRTYATPEKPLANLAINQLKQGQPQQALEHAARAIRANQAYARAYDIYVQALGKAAGGAAGLEYQTLARDLDASLDFHLNLGQAFLKGNDGRRARPHLMRVVALNPSSDQASRARQALKQLP
jgi:Tfp pilus assembly protein PilF